MSIDMLFGQVEVKVISYRNSPEGKVIQTQKVSSHSKINVNEPVDKSKSQLPTDIFSEQSRYKITITPI